MVLINGTYGAVLFCQGHNVCLPFHALTLHSSIDGMARNSFSSTKENLEHANIVPGSILFDPALLFMRIEKKNHLNVARIEPGPAA